MHEKVIAIIQDEINRLEEIISVGPVSDYDEYTKLRFCRDLLKDLKKDVEKLLTSSQD